MRRRDMRRERRMGGERNGNLQKNPEKHQHFRDWQRKEKHVKGQRKRDQMEVSNREARWHGIPEAREKALQEEKLVGLAESFLEVIQD